MTNALTPNDFAPCTFKKGDTAYIHGVWNDLSSEANPLYKRTKHGACVVYHRKVTITSWGKVQATAVDAHTGEKLRMHLATDGQHSVRPAADFAYLGALVTEQIACWRSYAARRANEKIAARWTWAADTAEAGGVRFAAHTDLVNAR